MPTRHLNLFGHAALHGRAAVQLNLCAHRNTGWSRTNTLDSRFLKSIWYELALHTLLTWILKAVRATTRPTPLMAPQVTTSGQKRKLCRIDGAQHATAGCFVINN